MWQMRPCVLLKLTWTFKLAHLFLNDGSVGTVCSESAAQAESSRAGSGLMIGPRPKTRESTESRPGPTSISTSAMAR